MQSVTHNIKKLSIVKALMGSLLLMPVIVLFFQDVGLSITEIFVLQSVFSISVVLLEVPTGYLGDILQRKTGLLLGALSRSLGRLLFMLADGFWLFAVAEVRLAVAFTFFSGSDVAMIYDTLEQTGEIKKFKSVQARFSSLSSFAEAGGAILGGYLATFGFGVVIGAQFTLSIIVVGIVATLVEPVREKFSNEEVGLKHLLGLIRYALFTKNTMSALIVFSSVTGVAGFIRVWNAQLYFNETGVPLEFFGVLRALLNLSVGIFALMTETIEKYISIKNLYRSFLLLPVIAYLVLGAVPSIYLIPVALVFYGVRGVSGVVYTETINAMSSSKERATIMSVSSLAFRGLFAVLGPIIGICMDVYSVGTGLVLIGVVIACLGVVGTVLVNRSGLLDVYVGKTE